MTSRSQDRQNRLRRSRRASRLPIQLNFLFASGADDAVRFFTRKKDSDETQAVAPTTVSAVSLAKGEPWES